MSASLESEAGHARTALPRRLTSEVFLWSIALGWIALLGWQVIKHASQLSSDLLILPPWICLLMIVNLFPLEGWQSSHFAADQSVTTAAALVLMPFEAGLVSFLGGLDSREFQGRVSISKALFNRTQVGLPTYLGSWAVHHFISRPSNSPYVLPAALLVLCLALVPNYLSVAVAISLERGYSIRHVLERLRLGAPIDFLLTLLASAVLGAMLGTLYNQIHPWALLAFVAPILLGRQVLIRSQMFIEARRAYSGRERVLVELSQRMSEERSDERRLIAADLHDEVLQPLFKVTLMAQVLKADLSSGRLLDMDEDLPELLAAAELASSTLRELIGDLRRSPLGRGGLSGALQGLAAGANDRTGLEVRLEVSAFSANPVRDLVIYQVAKEALSNVVQHSHASHARLELSSDSNDVRLVVSDDGRGFDLSLEKEGHYGIQIMKERAASINAQLFIDSDPGGGCIVTLVVSSANPDELPRRTNTYP